MPPQVQPVQKSLTLSSDIRDPKQVSECDVICQLTLDASVSLGLLPHLNDKPISSPFITKIIHLWDWFIVSYNYPYPPYIRQDHRKGAKRNHDQRGGTLKPDESSVFVCQLCHVQGLFLWVAVWCGTSSVMSPLGTIWSICLWDLELTVKVWPMSRLLYP